jgi:hypothetical protein
VWTVANTVASVLLVLIFHYKKSHTCMIVTVPPVPNTSIVALLHMIHIYYTEIAGAGIIPYGLGLWIIDLG